MSNVSSILLYLICIILLIDQDNRDKTTSDDQFSHNL